MRSNIKVMDYQGNEIFINTTSLAIMNCQNLKI